MENRVAGLTVMGMQMKVDDAYFNAELQLEEGYRNLGAAVAVGVCYRANENFQGSAPWPHEHSTASRKQCVRGK